MWRHYKPWRHARLPTLAATRSRVLNSGRVKLPDSQLCAWKAGSAARKGRFALGVILTL
ncbi:protein of unknown function (plasmid) [Caballeronia sp. S22]